MSDLTDKRGPGYNKKYKTVLSGQNHRQCYPDINMSLHRDYFLFKISAIITRAAINKHQFAITIFKRQFMQMKENFTFSTAAFSTNCVKRIHSVVNNQLHSFFTPQKISFISC